MVLHKTFTLTFTLTRLQARPSEESITAQEGNGPSKKKKRREEASNGDDVDDGKAKKKKKKKTHKA